MAGALRGCSRTNAAVRSDGRRGTEAVRPRRSWVRKGTSAVSRSRRDRRSSHWPTRRRFWVTDAERPSQSRLVVNSDGSRVPARDICGRQVAGVSIGRIRQERGVRDVGDQWWEPSGLHQRRVGTCLVGRWPVTLLPRQRPGSLRRRSRRSRASRCCAVIPCSGTSILQGVERTNYDVSPDGKEFLFTRRGEDQQRAVLVFGWLDELRERMAQAAGK